MSRTDKDKGIMQAARSSLQFMPKKFRQLMNRKRRRTLNEQTKAAKDTEETNVDKPERVANAKWNWL